MPSALPDAAIASHEDAHIAVCSIYLNTDIL